jgi:LPS export ABC transporter protein LptC
MSWHKPVRVAVGVFGLAATVGVYFAIGSRQSGPAPQPVERLDPKAMLESTDAVLQQSRRGEEDFEVKADRTLNYEDGSAKLMGVRVSVRKRDGRDFIVTAREASAGKDRKDLVFKGDVVLEASDGFRLTTADATYTDEQGLVRAPGKVAFTKGGMSGSGLGMTYDKNNDVLTLLAEADVTMAGTEAAPGTSFKAGSALLDRVMDVLVLSNGGHAQRGEQTFEAMTITARLAPDEQYVRLVELRGDARVAGGGGALDSMSAQSIDLLYVEGGEALDRVTLTGQAAAALTSKGGSGKRQMTGGVLEMQLAPDGTLVHAGGRDGIRFDLPGSDRARANSIQSKTFDANGTAGAGLTSATFTDDVQFREDVPKGAPRVARSRTLDVSLEQDEVSSAMFRGSVSFEDRGLAACAAQVRYNPQGGTIELSGADAGGGPRASDERVAIAADTIDVTLQGTEIAARGGVKTVMRPTREARGNCVPRAGGDGDAAPKTAADESKLPGLLKEKAPVNVNADRMSYAGAGGAATYTGNAALWQGSDTSIRADELRLDQSKGDMLATGAARSALTLGDKPSVGRADVIRYDDAKRLVTYESTKPIPVARGRNAGRGAVPPVAPQASARGAPSSTAPQAPARGATPAGRTAAAGRGGAPGRAAVVPGPTQAYVSGPQGQLRAWRIEMVLTPDAGKADRLEAYDEVNLTVDQRRANGERLTYFAEDERYVMTGSATAPVCVVDPDRATTGKTLVFYKSADKVLVDGNEEFRTQTKSGGPCASSPTR